MAKLVSKAPTVYPLPSSEPRLLGLAQISGEPVAVVDLHALFDPDGDPGGSHELTIIVRCPDRRSTIGLAVDEAFGVVAVEDPTDAEPNDPDYVAGRGSMHDRPIVILDPERLFQEVDPR